MRNNHSSHSVNSQILRISVQTILAATLALAITFTLSCSGGDDNGSPPSVTKGKFTDSRDGKSYETVKIGSQTWMAENLNYDTGTDGSKCYDNDPGKCTTYGRLYNWETAKTACPQSWHLPSDAEWSMLVDFVASDVGTKLKAKSGWNSGGNGTDIYGFSALPGGRGFSDGSFNLVGYYGVWWSATDGNASSASHWSTYYSPDLFSRGSHYDKSFLFSVRCVQD
jgi:uncharacterized protein (TIGR02145 family)